MDATDVVGNFRWAEKNRLLAAGAELPVLEIARDKSHDDPNNREDGGEVEGLLEGDGHSSWFITDRCLRKFIRDRQGRVDVARICRTLNCLTKPQEQR